MSNLGWLLARKHPTADNIQAAVDLEEAALTGEIGRINGSLGELEKQKEFFRIRLEEIKEEQSRLIIEFPRDRTGEKTKRLRAGTLVVTEYYYSNFNYRSIGVRRGLGTPEVGGGIWLTEVEREVVSVEFESRYRRKDDTEKKETPSVFVNKTMRLRDGTNQEETRFPSPLIRGVAEKRGVGTLRAGGVVWLTATEFASIQEDIRLARIASNEKRKTAIKAGLARNAGRTLGKLP